MDIDQYRNYCLSKPSVTESFPFDDVTLVFKVLGKMFTLANIENFVRINVKCDPKKAIALRDKYIDRIIPAWHMNKKHWNTIYLAGFRTEDVIGWIDHSYDCVIKTLPKKDQIQINGAV